MNPKIKSHFLENKINIACGGATKRGFNYALKNKIKNVIKVAADDQMDLPYIPNLLSPLLEGKADVTKGNRFRDLKVLRKMPVVRRVGSLVLSFLIKAAAGSWTNFDPTNGYLTIKTSALKDIDFSKLSNRYYFETSLLAEFYFQKV